MIELRNWRSIRITQNYPETSCIPAGIEWLLRYLQIEYNLLLHTLDLDNFQNEFDLEHLRLGTNSFGSISKRLKELYPELKLDYQQKFFDKNQGLLKIQQIEKLISINIPVLYSAIVRIQPNKGVFHIMPVVAFNHNNIYFYNYATENTNDLLLETSKMILIQNHQNLYPGGNDILWIEP